MIKEISIENFKSIAELKLELGRFNVLIGENGCGKTNILEAAALGAAAAADKLDNEFLGSRGIRVTAPGLMRAAFDPQTRDKDISVKFTGNDDAVTHFQLENDNKPYSKWMETRLEQLSRENGKALTHQKINAILGKFPLLKASELSEFIIYSPENTTLRVFEREGQILPLGIKGEGLFKLIKTLLSAEDTSAIDEVKENLKLIDWFEDFGLPEARAQNEFVLEIRDRYLDVQLNQFDQRSSNEGFLFLLFYLCLFISEDTPVFFAIDNLEASFNPKLCAEVSKTLVKLAKAKNKQVIVTTQNPSILDGINLHDPDQRLFVIKRNTLGHTVAKRIRTKPDAENPVKLSEAWTRGYIGGLPKNF